MAVYWTGETPVYSSIAYRSYAKVNLYLDVLKRRRDGYHNIETIFQTVGLADVLTFLNDTHISLSTSGAELDNGEGNLVCQAARLLKQETGYTGGARIRLEKRIPIAAGLAGGSGDAAATLIALNKLWDLRLPLVRLSRLGRMLGADVSYCLHGGTMAGTLRGDQLAPLPQIHGHWFVLLHPALAVSAGQVYGSPALRLSREKTFAGRSATFRRVISRLASGNVSEVVSNSMEFPVFQAYPILRAMKEMLRELGCRASAMSGSGPTLYGLCASQQKALRVADAFRERYADCKVSVAAAVPFGVERIQ